MKNKLTKLLGCTLALSTIFSITTTSAEESSHPLFQDGDKVCFIGNSITMGGQYTKYIMQYYTTRYPLIRLHYRNNGLGGDITRGVLDRIDTDILSNDPDVAIMMIGMNDSGENITPDLDESDEAAVARENQMRYDLYTSYLDQINEILSQNSRELILFTPSIYDEMMEKKNPGQVGRNHRLYTYGEYVKESAPRYDAKVVDIWAKSNAVSLALQKDDPNNSFVGKNGDRIHPGGFGGFIMANEFIKSVEEPSFVSKVVIDASKSELKESIRAEVNNISGDKTTLSFDMLAEGLPFVFDKESLRACEFNSFLEDYNREIVTVTGLKKGDYQLLIDDVVVGEYSNKELSEGVNLSMNELTPQYQQSKAVMNENENLRKTTYNNRVLPLVEHRILHLRSDFEEYLRPDAVIREVTKRLETETQGYYIDKYKLYIEFQPKRDQMFVELMLLQDKLYEMSQPQTHTYKIVKK
ncbi:MAG: SGNH/GDSL hydrolase family protein [Rikenellaceae bacterium]